MAVDDSVDVLECVAGFKGVILVDDYPVLIIGRKISDKLGLCACKSPDMIFKRLLECIEVIEVAVFKDRVCDIVIADDGYLEAVFFVIV